MSSVSLCVDGASSAGFMSCASLPGDRVASGLRGHHTFDPPCPAGMEASQEVPPS